MTGFLSGDWGSSSFRLRLVDAEGAVRAQIASDRGASVIAADLPAGVSQSDRDAGFAAQLDAMIAQLAREAKASLADVPTVLSGMVTSAHGWCELPYATVPFALDGSDVKCEERRAADGRRLFFVSGVCTGDDVIRGEECELIGLMNTAPWRERADGCVVVMPGTHSKHVRIQNGRMTGFTTFMTGELYDVLAQHSVLARTVDIAAKPEASDAFRAGVRAAQKTDLAAALFKVRTNGLFDRFDAAANANYLSGLLIGNELAELAEPHSATPILLCADEPLRTLYQTAMDSIAGEADLLVTPAGVSGQYVVQGHRVCLETMLA